MDVIHDKDGARTTLIAMGVPDAEAGRLIKEVDVSIAISDVARDIAKEKGISLGHAYKLAREQQQPEPVPNTWGKKDQILEVLYRLNSNGGVSGEGLHGQAKAMGVAINIHELVALLWDLQKQQLVKFAENHTGSGSSLYRIRLTPTGRSRIVNKRGSDPVKELRRSSQVQVVREARPKPEVLPAIKYKDPRKQDPLPQNMKAPFPVIDETSAIHSSPIPAHMEVDGKVLEDMVPDTHTQYPGDIEAKYPLLAQLIKRSAEQVVLRQKAAVMVQAAEMIAKIDPTEADVLIARAGDLEGPSFTPLEQEILSYLLETTGQS